MLLRLLAYTFIMTILTSCGSIEGTRNKSYTYRKMTSSVKIDKLAMIPIEDTSKYPYLHEMIERNVVESLLSKSPQSKIFTSKEFSHYLYQNGSLEDFSNWYNGYKVTKYMDASKLRLLIDNLDVNYLLFVRSINIDREKIRAADTGYYGMVSDADNVWRINLRFIGELVNLENGKIVWQGVGFSEDINSPTQQDYFFVIKNELMPEIEEILPKMVAIAADGFTNEMLGIRTN